MREVDTMEIFLWHPEAYKVEPSADQNSHIDTKHGVLFDLPEGVLVGTGDKIENRWRANGNSKISRRQQERGKANTHDIQQRRNALWSKGTVGRGKPPRIHTHKEDRDVRKTKGRKF